MIKMPIDFFLLNAQGLGNLSDRHFGVVQEFYDLLTDRPHLSYLFEIIPKN